MTRRTVYRLEKDGAAFHIEEKGDGSVCLMRTTEVDDGPARSVVIDGEALPVVAAELWAMAMRNTVASIEATIRQIREHPVGSDL